LAQWLCGGATHRERLGQAANIALLERDPDCVARTGRAGTSRHPDATSMGRCLAARQLGWSNRHASRGAGHRNRRELSAARAAEA
jgi:hypothetical protein